MGFYCSVTLPVRCPFCGTVEERECQTKDLQDIFLFEHWRAGANILADIPHELRCIAGCGQPSCGALETFNGKPYTRERHFTVVVKLDNGMITGEYEAFDEDPA